MTELFLGVANLAKQVCFQLSNLSNTLADRGDVSAIENFRLDVTYLQFSIKVCFSATVGHTSSW